MGLSLAKIEAIAPDQGSLSAARKLTTASSWPSIAEDGAGLLWGECQGSGATPYRISVTEADAGYTCNCPSRKFPCKHALALMWMRVEGKVAFAPGTPPAWVTDWLSRRRGSSAPKAADDLQGEKPERSVAAVTDAEEAIDPRAQARAAAARERNRLERESAIAAGLDELEIWLADQVDAGLAGFPAKASAACRVMAQRLFDAKAPGLALMVDTLPARLFALAQAARPLAAVQELGMLHLLLQAYRRQAHLPGPLMHDLRQTVGWTVTREALLAVPGAQLAVPGAQLAVPGAQLAVPGAQLAVPGALLAVPGIVRHTATWRVWATRSEVQPDKLRRLETWLYGNGQHAVLIDYVPVKTGAAAGGFSVGDMFDAELAYYPSPVPLRAVIVRQLTGAVASTDAIAFPDQDLATAHAAYETALSEKPWLGDFPLCFRGARIRRAGERLHVTGQTVSLPLAPSQSATAWPLLEFDAIDGAGLWDGTALTLGWTETPLGRWTA